MEQWETVSRRKVRNKHTIKENSDSNSIIVNNSKQYMYAIICFLGRDVINFGINFIFQI